LFWRTLEQGDTDPFFRGSQCGAERCITATHDDNVEIRIGHPMYPRVDPVIPSWNDISLHAFRVRRIREGVKT